MSIQKYEKFLTKSIFLFPLLMVLMGIIVTGISFFIALKTFQTTELSHIKDNLLNENKTFLKDSVDNLDEDIKISMNSLIDQKKEKSKLDIETISETLEAIYDKNGTKQFLGEILNSINKIRKRRYFGVIDMKTKMMIIHPIQKVLNKDTSKMQLGKYSLYEWVIKTTNNPKHEGFFTVTFYKPNKKKQVTKIVFVKYLKDLNWAIGTGEYLDEIIKVIKSDVIKKILSKKGEYSIIDISKNTLYNKYKIQNITNPFDKKDKLNQGFFEIKDKKLIYSKLNKELNLVIQKSISLEKINKFIKIENDKLADMYKKFYNILFVILLCIITISMIISIIISQKIEEIFKIYEKLNTDKIQAEYEANHDILTGAYNRTFFNKQIKEEILKSQLRQKTMCIAILDIDHFKKINDTYGHQEGDEVLKKFVKFIQSHLRENDIFSRWGGEEFVVIFQAKADDVKKRLEQIKNNLVNNEKLQSPVKFTFSAGIAEYTQEDNEDSLIKKADEALYEAKKTRNTIVVYKLKS